MKKLGRVNLAILIFALAVMLFGVISILSTNQVKAGKACWKITRICQTVGPSVKCWIIPTIVECPSTGYYPGDPSKSVKNVSSK